MEHITLNNGVEILLAEDFWKLYTERNDCEVVH